MHCQVLQSVDHQHLCCFPHLWHYPLLKSIKTKNNSTTFPLILDWLLKSFLPEFTDLKFYILFPPFHAHVQYHSLIFHILAFYISVFPSSQQLISCCIYYVLQEFCSVDISHRQLFYFVQEQLYLHSKTEVFSCCPFSFASPERHKLLLIIRLSFLPTLD